MYENLTASAMLPKKFLLIVGNARSGTTIVGAIIDSHSQMLCANESSASVIFWRDMDREQILGDIITNCRDNLAHQRPSEGYLYAIKTNDKSDQDIAVIADKIWNPTLLLLAGQRNLLESLQDRTGAEIVLLHCVRNPFDVIATMHRRSGATLRDRLNWYDMHCSAIQMVMDRDEYPLHLWRHEDLSERPVQVCSELFDWLGYPTSDAHLQEIQARVHSTARRPRHGVEWSDDLVRDVDAMIARYAFLEGYTLES